uniref:Uncharacterized protein n=1 Tax=Arundo donax TaxID=35708 RepID=A0A0A9CKS1_ARUDO
MSVANVVEPEHTNQLINKLNIITHGHPMTKL